MNGLAFMPPLFGESNNDDPLSWLSEHADLWGYKRESDLSTFTNLSQLLLKFYYRNINNYYYLKNTILKTVFQSAICKIMYQTSLSLIKLIEKFRLIKELKKSKNSSNVVWRSQRYMQCVNNQNTSWTKSNSYRKFKFRLMWHVSV